MSFWKTSAAADNMKLFKPPKHDASGLATSIPELRYLQATKVIYA
jgi:hypothetical protein